MQPQIQLQVSARPGSGQPLTAPAGPGGTPDPGQGEGPGFAKLLAKTLSGAEALLAILAAGAQNGVAATPPEGTSGGAPAEGGAKGASGAVNGQVPWAGAQLAARLGLDAMSLAVSDGASAQPSSQPTAGEVAAGLVDTGPPSPGGPGGSAAAAGSAKSTAGGLPEGSQVGPGADAAARGKSLAPASPKPTTTSVGGLTPAEGAAPSPKARVGGPVGSVEAAVTASSRVTAEDRGRAGPRAAAAPLGAPSQSGQAQPEPAGQRAGQQAGQRAGRQDEQARGEARDWQRTVSAPQPEGPAKGLPAGKTTAGRGEVSSFDRLAAGLAAPAEAHPDGAAPEVAEAPARAAGVVHQLAERLAGATPAGRSELELWLVPEHLGSVRVQLAIENGSLVARMVVGSAHTKQLLDEGLDQLRQALRNQGFDVAGLSVEMGGGRGPELQQGGREQGWETWERQGMYPPAHRGAPTPASEPRYHGAAWRPGGGRLNYLA